MQAAVAAALRTAEVRERLAGLGAEPVGDTPEAFARFLRAESELWGRLVREGNIRAE
jgi:tripartite-type tricarboxylate transporter receptor subunit TctC